MNWLKLTMISSNLISSCLNMARVCFYLKESRSLIVVDKPIAHSVLPLCVCVTTESSPLSNQLNASHRYFSAKVRSDGCFGTGGSVCVCMTSAGCVESGHNHGEAEALVGPRKALYVCICGYGNWAPPFCKLTHLTGPMPGPLYWYLYMCVWLADDVYGSHVTMISATQPSCWTWSPGLALYPITKASWLVAHNCMLRRSSRGFFLCSSVINHWGEL